jgi:hypothetical protein
MKLRAGLTLDLLDIHNHLLGRVTIERLEKDWIHGAFEAGADFEAHRALFQEFEALVNDQVFPRVDDIAEQINALKICLVGSSKERSSPVQDIQIMDRTKLSFRPFEGSGASQPT